MAGIAAEKDTARAYAGLADMPPVYRSLVLVGSDQNNPEQEIFARQALTARSWFQADSAAVSAILSDMVESIQANALDVKTALSRAEETINGIIRGK